MLSLIHDVRYAMDSARILAGYLDRLGREDLILALVLRGDAGVEGDLHSSSSFFGDMNQCLLVFMVF